LKDLEVASMFSYAEDDPNIKRIESRGSSYDFGAGCPEVLTLFEAHIQKYHSNMPRKGLQPSI
jgi:hypothetical protein